MFIWNLWAFVDLELWIFVDAHEIYGLLLMLMRFMIFGCDDGSGLLLMLIRFMNFC